MTTKILATCSLLLISNFALAAIDFSHCNALLEHGVNNITTNKSARHANAYNYHKYCKSSSYKQSDQAAASAHASIFGYGSGGVSGNTSAMKEEIDNWCTENQNLSAESSELFAETRLISSAALSAWNSCQTAATKQVVISLRNQSENNEFMHFTVDSTSDGNIYLNSVLQKGYICEVSHTNEAKLSSLSKATLLKIGIGGYEENVIDSPILIKNENAHIDCRTASPSSTTETGTGVLTYESGSIAINTSGPSFSIDIPKIVKEYVYTAAGAVMAFDSDTCPAGWEPYKLLSGRTIIGVGSGDKLTSRKLGDMGGSETHLLTVNEMPNHHHSYLRETQIKGGCGLEGCNYRSTYPSYDTGATGGSQPHNNMPPFVALLYCKKS